MPTLGVQPDSLPGGGIYNPKNIGLFTYTYNSPVVLIDPDGNRPLTQGEMQLVWQVFGESVDTSRVDVYQKPIFKGSSVVLGFANTILFGDLKTDFSKENLTERRHFIHEMTHIMQSQNGMWTTIRGIGMQVGAYLKGFFKGLFSLSNPHAAGKAEVDSLYDLSGVASGATLNDLNMEQQAEAISYDYSGSVKDVDPTQGTRSSTENIATTIRNNSPDLPNEWGEE